MQQPTRPRLSSRLFRFLVAWFGTRWKRAESMVANASLPRFATAAPGLEIQFPRIIEAPERIYLGSDVKLGPGCVLRAKTSYPGSWLSHPDGEHEVNAFDPQLHIGDRVTATAALGITVFHRVTIEDDVTFGADVFIADGTHATTRGDVPYKYQGIDSVAPVRIGRGSWIGKNVVIMPGVSIGAYVVVGANAVVTGDVPDGSIAVGAPARVISRWDPTRERWRATDEATTERSGEDAVPSERPRSPE